MRDALLSPPPGTPRPLDYAPHLWRAVQERLRYYDQRFRAASIDEESFDLPLEELVGSLKELLEAGATGNFYPLDATVQQIARLRVNVCPQVAPAYSLAMLQMLSRQGCLPAAPPMEEAAARFDQLIASGSQEDLEKWLAESLPEGFADFSEIRLTQQLIESPGLSWDEIQLAVRTRRQAEQVAAASRTTLPWIREMLESADRMRRRGGA